MVARVNVFRERQQRMLRKQHTIADLNTRIQTSISPQEFGQSLTRQIAMFPNFAIFKSFTKLWTPLHKVYRNRCAALSNRENIKSLNNPIVYQIHFWLSTMISETWEDYGRE